MRYEDPSRGTQTLQINRVLAAPGRTSVEWTITSVADQDITQLQNWGPPISDVPPDELYIATGNAASGPVLVLGRGSAKQRLHASWVATEINGQQAYECLCTDVGLWANGLRRAGGTVRVTTNYPALPRDVRTLDIELPGFGTFRDVPVRSAPDSASRSGPVRPGPGAGAAVVVSRRGSAPRLVDGRLADPGARSDPARQLSLHRRAGGPAPRPVTTVPAKGDDPP